METIELIGAPQSIYVRAVRMAFEEKGVAYRLSPAAPGSARVVVIHPFGKIPVMRHGGFSLFESKAIATYIDLSYPGPRLVPTDAREASLTEQWVSALNSGILPTAIPYMQANVFPKGPRGERDEGIVRESIPKIERFLQVLDAAVSGTGYLVASAFSLADIYLLPLLGYLGLFPESAELLVKSSALVAYFAAHSSRASFVDTIPPPLEELR